MSAPMLFIFLCRSSASGGSLCFRLSLSRSRRSAGSHASRSRYIAAPLRHRGRRRQRRVGRRGAGKGRDNRRGKELSRPIDRWHLNLLTRQGFFLSINRNRNSLHSARRCPGCAWPTLWARPLTWRRCRSGEREIGAEKRESGRLFFLLLCAQRRPQTSTLRDRKSVV